MEIVLNVISDDVVGGPLETSLTPVHIPGVQIVDVELGRVPGDDPPPRHRPEVRLVHYTPIFQSKVGKIKASIQKFVLRL